jgi:hypothetical protein
MSETLRLNIKLTFTDNIEMTPALYRQVADNVLRSLLDEVHRGEGLAPYDEETDEGTCTSAIEVTCGGVVVAEEIYRGTILE